MENNIIPAINTVYNGYKFRSRLEARWAVFFDIAGIKYQYEPEGLILNGGTWYLPDFYLPWFNCYVEIKPDGLSDDKYQEAKFKCKLLFETISCCTMLCVGDPMNEDMTVFCNVGFIDFFGNVFKKGGSKDGFSARFDNMVCDDAKPLYGLFINHKLLDRYVDAFDSCRQHHTLYWVRLCTMKGVPVEGIPADCIPKVGDTWGFWGFCGFDKEYKKEIACIEKSTYKSTRYDRLNSAKCIARQARFEHGETPNPDDFRGVWRTYDDKEDTE